MSRDPLGYVDGLGLYEFVGGNPENWTDSMGLYNIRWSGKWDSEYKTKTEAALNRVFQRVPVVLALLEKKIKALKQVSKFDFSELITQLQAMQSLFLKLQEKIDSNETLYIEQGPCPTGSAEHIVQGYYKKVGREQWVFVVERILKVNDNRAPNTDFSLVPDAERDRSILHELLHNADKKQTDDKRGFPVNGWWVYPPAIEFLATADLSGVANYTGEERNVINKIIDRYAIGIIGGVGGEQSDLGDALLRNMRNHIYQQIKDAENQ